MLVSAIIRTKNSEETIEQCLNYLFKQSHKPLEVIIVDAGSTDRTLELVRKYECKLIEYPRHEEFNYAKAINIGAEAANGDYLLILSSHSILLDTNMISWMRLLLEKEEKTVAVSFNRHEQWEETNLTKVEAIKWEPVHKGNFKGRGMYNFCAFIRKKDWEAQPFNEDIPRCEDQEWIWRQLEEKDANAVFIQHPKVYYKNPYYNFRKDLWDYIVIGNYVYPKFKSFDFIFENYKLALLTLLRLRTKRFWYHFRLGSFLLKEKIVPSSKHKIRSIYHPKLN